MPESTASTTTDTPGLYAAIVHLSGGINGMLPGPMHAALARANHTAIDEESLWRCLNHFVRPHLEIGTHIPAEDEIKWFLLAVGLATIPHDRSDKALRLGTALGVTGYQESNLHVLLRTEPTDELFGTYLLRALRFLAREQVRLNWLSIGAWIFTTDEDSLEKTRRSIARDYYAAVHAAH